MGYQLEAVIGSDGALRAALEGQSAAAFVPLRHELVLVPMTDELFDALTDGTGPALGFAKLPGGLDRELAAWSAGGPIGYAEADFFGGVGTQRAALWADGRLVLGPLAVAEDEPFPAGGSPISQLLARLGVARGRYHDEFEAAGLGRHRETADWLP